jgi:hypothetical protein
MDMETVFTFPRSGDVNLQFQLSFRPFIAFLKAQQHADEPADGLRVLYDYLIDTFSSAQAQQDAQSERLDGEQLTKLFQLATVAVLPLDHTKRKIPYAFGTPVPLEMFLPAHSRQMLRHTDY